MYMHSTAHANATGALLDTPSTLVFRTVLQGAANLVWRNREVRLDEDAWLVLEGREPCSVRFDTELRTRMLVVVVPEDDRRAALARGAGAAFDAQTGPSIDEPPSLDLGFADNLRPRASAAGRRLVEIARARDTGGSQADEREQRIELVCDAWAEELTLRRRAARIGCVKRATREQLLRRILLAADFIASRHDDPISLDQMARAASLSRFHFVRLFSLVHGETPHAFLRRKRTTVARRHLAVGSACSEAASRAGFGSRSSLFRNLRKMAPVDAGGESCCLSA